MRIQTNNSKGERHIIGHDESVLEQEHLNRYYFALRYTKNKKVLDIACGTGYGTAIISQVAKQVIGVDISLDSIVHARENYSKKNTEFLQGTATNLHFFKNNSFDVVVSFETIEHIRDHHTYLMEVKRVLKDKGIFICSTPNKKIVSPYTKKPRNPHHVREYTLKDFRSLIRKYFKQSKFLGQNHQSKVLRLMQFIYRLFPRNFFESTMPKKSLNKYKKKQKISIIHKDVDNCKYFLVICRKMK